MPRLVTGIALAAAIAGAAWSALAPDNSALAVLLVGAGLAAACVGWLETGPGSAKELALVATIAAAAAACRVLFVAVPGVQPVTVVVVATGVALGLRAGVLTGGIAAFVSNFFLGQGPWTPWQVLGWAACGAVGAFAAPLLRRRIPFVVACFVLGYAFSSLMDLWEWWSFFPHTEAALLVQLGRGVWFSTAHAVGNVVLALVAGPELRRLLERYGRRLRTELVWA